MIKPVFRTIFGSLLSLLALYACAESNPLSIVESEDVNMCTEKSSTLDNECLSSVNERIEKELNAEYQEKLTAISTYDYSQWWMGNIAQREGMKASFIRSQALWLKYRQEYCKAASAGAEGVDGYGALALSCSVNMAKRRIEEIRLVHPNLSNG